MAKRVKKGDMREKKMGTMKERNTIKISLQTPVVVNGKHEMVLPPTKTGLQVS